MTNNLIIFALAAFVFFLAVIVNDKGPTGPGCPDDPDWLGYCSDIIGAKAP